MLEAALRSTLLLAAAWALIRLAPRASAATRHRIWHASFIALLVVPLVAPFVSGWMPPSWKPHIPWITVESSPPPSFAPAESGDGAAAANPPAGDVTAIAQLRASSQTIVASDRLPAALSSVQWAGSLLALLWFSAGWVATRSMRHRATPAPARWQLEVNALRERLKIPGEVRVAVLEQIQSPVAVGLRRSMILLPSCAHAWSADRRRAVWLHELAHIRRGDCRVQLITQAVRIAYWFNPLVWMAAAALRAECERACDDDVLMSGMRPSSYATHLLDVARDLRPRLQPSAALAMARTSQLEGRVNAVLRTGAARVPRRGSRFLVGVVSTLCAALVLGLEPAGAGVQEAAAPDQQSPVASQRFDVTLEAARAVARSTHAAATATLESSHDAQDRRDAATLLARLAAPGDIATLRQALDDPDQDVRERAAIGLAFMPGDEVVPALLDALTNVDAQVREKAAIGLSLRRDPRIVEPLLHAMRDPDAQVREKAAIALGSSGDERAVPALREALEDPDAQVREKAAAGLALFRLIP